ncbi:MAG: aldehyde dehydrogenase family protein [Candidatus Hydrogenedentes bacterium]|nr:aldehyde dehydrogenase family protein [Candidatus Hydrogenedentota bacterium]
MITESTLTAPQTSSASQAAPNEIAVRNPRTGKTIYTFREPTDQEIQQSFERARAAFGTIRAMTVRERLEEIGKIKRYFLANKEKIVDRIVEETGKARTDALVSEVFAILDIIHYYQKNAEKVLGDQVVSTPLLQFPKKSKIYYEPIGTVLIISPWNFPLNLALVPIVTAFTAGNSVVFKPSEWTPLCGLIEEIVEESGFMKEAITVVYGGKDVGRKLIDQRPAKILFTGSTRAGRQIMEQAAKYLIPVELELGGKDPMVVFDDVDVERAAKAAAWGGMMNCGQTCTSVERIIVQEGVYPEFVAALKRRIEKLSHAGACEGKADEGNLDVGCITADFQVKIVEEQIKDAKAKGAEVFSAGTHTEGSHAIPPTMITNVDKSMKVLQDETFGPVVTVEKFKTEDEAVAMANDSPYGLSGSVWSQDLVRAERVARRIETGSLSINNVLATQGNPGLPFGGTKDSGFGRYKGPLGLQGFSNPKSVLIDHTKKPEVYWYPYSKEKYHLFSRLLDAIYGGSPFWVLKAALIGLKMESLAKKKRK